MLKSASRRSFLRSGQKLSSGTLDAWGASPDNTRLSAPVAVTFSWLPARAWCERVGPTVVLAGAAAGYGGGPQTAGHLGCRIRQPPRCRTPPGHVVPDRGQIGRRMSGVIAYP